MRPLLIFVLSFCILIPLFGADVTKEEAIAYREEGYKLQAMGDLSGALSYYEKAVQIDPYYVEAYNDLGVVYESLGDDRSALSMYEETLKVNPFYLPAHTNLAFFYERQGDIEKATEHWVRRYELGKKGEYWNEVALQHLMRLGTYPKVKKEWLEKAAARLSKDIAYEREQKRLKLNEEARLHFDIGQELFRRGEYAQAKKELEIAGDLNPSDDDLRLRIFDFYKKAFHMQKRAEALAFAEHAVAYLKSDNFISAGDKLKDALTAVLQVAQERIGD